MSHEQRRIVRVGDARRSAAARGDRMVELMDGQILSEKRTPTLEVC